MRESKEARKERQAKELWTFVDVLRRAGNIVEEEVPLFNPKLETNWRIDLTLPKAEVLWQSGNVTFGHNSPIALEIDGIGFSHGSRAGIIRDREKGREAVIAGYRLLRVTREEIGNGDALELLARAGVQTEPKAVDSPSITTHMRPDVPE